MSAATTSAAAACQESRAAELELAQGDINYLLKIPISTFSILYNQVSGAAQKSTSKGRLDEAEGEGLAALPLQEADQHQGVRR